MAAADDIRSHLDVSQIAQYLGTDEATAGRAVDDALETLVGAMDRNVADPQGAVSLGRALGDHTGTGAYGEPIDVVSVDVADGEKIVDHVLPAAQMQTLGGDAGGSLLRKLLPLLAPIVMSYLARRLQDQLGGGTRQQRAPREGGQPGSGGGLTDVLGDLLGGGQSGAGQSGGGFGDILGDLLGGGRTAPAEQPQRNPQPQPPQTQQQPAPRQPGQGGFHVPDAGQTDLRMDAGEPQAGAPASDPGRQGGGSLGGDVLGGILSDLLRGRR